MNYAQTLMSDRRATASQRYAAPHRHSQCRRETYIPWTGRAPRSGPVAAGRGTAAHPLKHIAHLPQQTLAADVAQLVRHQSPAQQWCHCGEFELRHHTNVHMCTLPQQALAAGAAQRAWHQSAAPAALNSALGGAPGPDWLAQPPARAVLLALVEAALQ